jgi:hypothetical protein
MADMNPELLRELLTRETPIYDSVERTAFKPEPPSIPTKPTIESGPAVTPMNPYMVSLLGGLMDTASTYKFLTDGSNLREDNALVAGLSKSPGKMALLGVGANLAMPLLWKKLAKKYPKLGEALAANQGALQFGYGALNTSRQGPTSSDAYTSSLVNNINQTSLKK